MDAGHVLTDRKLKKLEKRLAKEYAQAAKEIKEKLDDYLRRFEIKDQIKMGMYERGEISKEDYQRWRIGQIMMGKRWQEMEDNLTQDLSHTHEIAQSVTRWHMADVYALNHDFGTFEVETRTGIDTSYTLYSRDAVEQILRENPDILPPPGKRVSAKIRAGLAERWDKQQIQSVMLQGILQGESIPNLARRLAASVADSDYKAAVRNARTMTTGAENAGRVVSYDRAKQLGIDVKQQWRATHDNRTRHTHRLVDGEIREVGEVFSNGCRFPGDPGAEPSEVYNCRCTLDAFFPKYDKEDNYLNGMTIEEFQQWQKEKEETLPILYPVMVGEEIKQSYIREYRDAMRRANGRKDRTEKG